MAHLARNRHGCCFSRLRLLTFWDVAEAAADVSLTHNRRGPLAAGIPDKGTPLVQARWKSEANPFRRSCF